MSKDFLVELCNHLGYDYRSIGSSWGLRNSNIRDSEFFFETGVARGIPTAHAKKIVIILDRLDATTELKDMQYPGSDFHELKGSRKGTYSVHINGNWTITFRFSNGEARDVDLEDYH